MVDDDSSTQAPTDQEFVPTVPFSMSFTQLYDEAFISISVFDEKQTMAVEDQC